MSKFLVAIFILVTLKIFLGFKVKETRVEAENIQPFIDLECEELEREFWHFKRGIFRELEKGKYYSLINELDKDLSQLKDSIGYDDLEVYLNYFKNNPNEILRADAAIALPTSEKYLDKKCQCLLYLNRQIQHIHSVITKEYVLNRVDTFGAKHLVPSVQRTAGDSLNVEAFTFHHIVNSRKYELSINTPDTIIAIDALPYKGKNLGEDIQICLNHNRTKELSCFRKR